MKLTATKSFLYNTRRLLAGDVFETVKPIHGKLLIAAKKAIETRTPGKLSAPPKAVAAKVSKASKIEPAAEDLGPLRDEYQEKVGKRPFMGWDADTLRSKMAEADAAPEAEAPAPEVPAEPEAPAPEELAADETDTAAS
jgi:hypothetical protein